MRHVLLKKLTNHTNAFQIIVYISRFHYISTQRSAVQRLNSNIFNLSSRGHLKDAMDEAEKLTKLFPNDETNNYILSTLLRGCIKTNNHSLTELIWCKFSLNNNWRPEPKCYVMAINSMIKNESKNKKLLCSLVDSLLYHYSFTLGAQGWWAILNCYRHFGDFDKMIQTWQQMLDMNIELTSHITHILFQGCLDCNKAQEYYNIWQQIMDNYNVKNEKDVVLLRKMFEQPHVLQTILVCIEKSRNYNNYGQDDIGQIWNFIVDKLKIKPSLECYCCGISACSHDVQSIDMFEKLVSQILNNDKLIEKLSKPKNYKHFRTALASYGNLKQLDQMWDFYNHVTRKYGHFDIEAITVLLSKENRKEKIMQGLQLILTNFNVDDMNYKYLKYIMRVATRNNFIEMKKKIETIMNKKFEEKTHAVLKNIDDNVTMDVWAEFEINNEKKVVHNGINSGDYHLISKIESLQQLCGYQMDTTFAQELPTKIAREKHLKSHAERKALVMLLEHINGEDNGNDSDKRIYIKVSMRMCGDCHNLFEKASKYVQRTIECIDPKVHHIFQHGKCQSCQQKLH